MFLKEGIVKGAPLMLSLILRKLEPLKKFFEIVKIIVSIFNFFLKKRTFGIRKTFLHLKNFKKKVFLEHIHAKIFLVHHYGI